MNKLNYILQLILMSLIVIALVFSGVSIGKLYTEPRIIEVENGTMLTVEEVDLNYMKLEDVTTIINGWHDRYQNQIDMLNYTISNAPVCKDCDCSIDYHNGFEDGMDRANLINNQYQ